MSFLSKLYVDGREYNVLEFNINFKKDIDTASKPIGNSKGGIINMTIEATHDSLFLSWMLNGDLAKDGKIVFYRRDALSKMKELVFEKAFCIDYYEEFTSTTEIPMKIVMELVCKTLTFGDAKFLNNWIELD